MLQRGADTRILEGLMTTLSADPADAPSRQRLNIAPMGPTVDESMRWLILRPFKTSTTYRNLKTTGEGVFHVTDDVLLLARAALGKVLTEADAPTRPARVVRGLVLTGACRYYEVRVTDLDDRDDRTTVRTEVVATGRLRDFWGLNRAMHAVLEAAILATRVHLTGCEAVLAEMRRLEPLVEKTGAERERMAFEEIRVFVASSPRGHGEGG